jgi:hypothetical protein
MFIAGIDAGRSYTKYKFEGGQGFFPSKIVPFYDHGGESPLKEPHDFIMEVRSGPWNTGPTEGREDMPRKPLDRLSWSRRRRSCGAISFSNWKSTWKSSHCQ